MRGIKSSSGSVLDPSVLSVMARCTHRFGRAQLQLLPVLLFLHLRVPSAGYGALSSGSFRSNHFLFSLLFPLSLNVLQSSTAFSCSVISFHMSAFCGAIIPLLLLQNICFFNSTEDYLRFCITEGLLFHFFQVCFCLNANSDVLTLC